MRTLRILPLLGAALLVAGCGLPDTYFLQAPTAVALAAPGNNSFSFSNPIHDLNHDINVNFSGDEIYYKLYGDTNIDFNAVDSTSSTDPSVQLTTKGFYPICLSTDSVGTRTDPVIAIGTTLAASGSSVTVTINSLATDPNGFSNFVLAANPALEIRRGVADQGSPTVYKVFQQNQFTLSDKSYVQADADFATAFSGASTNGVLYIAWYALSYGRTTSGTPVRSTAVYLGYMSIPYQL